MIAEYLEYILSSQKTQNFLGDAKRTLSREESQNLIDRISMVLHNRVAEIEGQARIAIYLPRNKFFLASIFADYKPNYTTI